MSHNKLFSHKWKLAAIVRKAAARRTTASASDLVRFVMKVAGVLTVLIRSRRSSEIKKR